MLFSSGYVEPTIVCTHTGLHLLKKKIIFFRVTRSPTALKNVLHCCSDSGLLTYIDETKIFSTRRYYF